MEDDKNRCKLCGSKFGLNDDPTQRWCEDCKDGIELISYLRDNLIPINEKTILDNIDKFVSEPISETLFESGELDRYLDLNYSLKQYEKIKLRSIRIRNALRLP
jgi:hypothetical protein